MQPFQVLAPFSQIRALKSAGYLEQSTKLLSIYYNASRKVCFLPIKSQRKSKVKILKSSNVILRPPANLPGWLLTWLVCVSITCDLIGISSLARLTASKNITYISAVAGQRVKRVDVKMAT
jgi:hypothetical protein